MKLTPHYERIISLLVLHAGAFSVPKGHELEASAMVLVGLGLLTVEEGRQGLTTFRLFNFQPVTA